ncbi:MAG TPA: ABC transporter ATP-binding protein [Kofleriaceae bacterium]|jgi:sulfonate transport system ATP-binding protein|nr:ABC transporter ATP-binding protein [Kofleriaceae bacterium]
MAEQPGSGIVLEGLEKRFDGPLVLSGLDLHVRPGELVTIVGRSGSGKSTLLRILAGLEEPTGGRARFVDASGGPAQATVRMVFQEPRLLPWRNVLANVCLGASPGLADAAPEVLRQVGLGERLDAYPGVLSGGQRQRVALARALLHRPTVMLLDEPFGSLDALTRIGAQRLVESLWLRHGFTTVLVTHDVEEAVLLGDRALVFEDGNVVAEMPLPLPRPRARELPEVGRLAGKLLRAVLGEPEISPRSELRKENRK